MYEYLNISAVMKVSDLSALQTKLLFLFDLLRQTDILLCLVDTSFASYLEEMNCSACFIYIQDHFWQHMMSNIQIGLVSYDP